MDKREHLSHLTNESIVKKFTSQFELVNYAIKLSEQMIQSQRAPLVKIDSQNPAVVIIEEINEGKDKLLDVVPIPKEIIAEPQMTNQSMHSGESFGKIAEKKKSRRILV